MRLLTALAVLLASLLVGPAAAQNTPPSTGEFTFTVCNNSGVALSFALISQVSAANGQLQIAGWYQSQPGCNALGSFPQGNFYFFAYGFSTGSSARLFTVGGNVMRCITTDAFSRSDNANDFQCGAFSTPFQARMLAGFAALNIPRTMNAYTVTVGPMS